MMIIFRMIVEMAVMSPQIVVLSNVCPDNINALMVIALILPIYVMVLTTVVIVRMNKIVKTTHVWIHSLDVKAIAQFHHAVYNQNSAVINIKTVHWVKTKKLVRLPPAHQISLNVLMINVYQLYGFVIRTTIVVIILTSSRNAIPVLVHLNITGESLYI